MRRSRSSCAIDYSLQGNRKTEEGADHPDRDAQFQYINDQVRRALAGRRPVVSVDTKKKELIGNDENQGRQWRRSKSPALVQGHDFPAPSVPRAYPYGVYDLARNKGFVNVGTDHDTGAFAVASIRGWWRFEGHRLYPRARRLLITADGGGSNGYRLRLSKFECRSFRCHHPGHRGLPLPTGNQQVEQGGAPPVLVHLLELAWRAAAGLRDDRAFDREHDDREGVGRLLSPRPAQVSVWAKSDRRRNEDDPHYPSGVPW